MDYSKLPTTVTERPSSPEAKTIGKKSRNVLRGLKSTFSILFGTLWLAPAVFILFINIQGHIHPRAGVLGQSIGCLGNSKRCKINLQDVNQISQAQKLAKMDKNALGALQLAAKAMEIWFVTIAASLVFISVKTIARRTSERALPIRFIFLHSALGEFLGLGKLLFWEPIKVAFERLMQWIRRMVFKKDEAITDRSGEQELSWWGTSRLYLFSIFVVFVSIICSLMGPATAILVLPNMEWTDINNDLGSTPMWLDTIQTGQPPLDITVPNCTASNFASGNFSCLTHYYAAFVDSLTAGAIATDTQAFIGGGDSSGIGNSIIVVPLFQEGNVTFTANISGGNPAIWVPLRQILRGFSDDVEDFDLATSSGSPPRPGYPDSGLFNKSLQARLQRDGPTVGMQGICVLNGTNEQTVHILSIGSDQLVRCYTANGEAQCIPSGSGWSGINESSSSFTVLDLDTKAQQNVNVNVYSASISLTVSNSTVHCIENGTCNWDWSRIFSNQTSSPNATITGPLQVMEYSSPRVDSNSSIWCTSHYATTSAEYVLDPSQVTNQFRLVELNVDGENGTLDIGHPLYVDSDWILTGWAVDRNGTVNSSRYIAGQLIIAWQNFVHYGVNTRSFPDFINIHRFTAIQSLSMITFTNTTTKPSNKVEAEKQLSSFAQIQAWKYDLDTRTSKLGIFVVAAGCFLVILRTIMYWFHGGDTMDATDILQSILKRYPLIRNERAVDERAVEVKEKYPILLMDDDTGDVGFRA
jgi:hypothetical protein